LERASVAQPGRASDL